MGRVLVEGLVEWEDSFAGSVHAFYRMTWQNSTTIFGHSEEAGVRVGGFGWSGFTGTGR
jgi:hypothetical protein